MIEIRLQDSNVLMMELKKDVGEVVVGVADHF